MDRISKSARSGNMSRIRRANTRPEMVVRRLLHGLGFRFRLHQKALPGTPDIVLPRWRTAVFVNGCFWHRHAGCPRANTPASRQDYWLPKLARNVERDREAQGALRALSWRVVVVWECETDRPDQLRGRLKAALAASDATALSGRIQAAPTCHDVDRAGEAGLP